MTNSDNNSTIKCILIDDEKENLDLMEYMLFNSGHKIQIQEKLHDPILAVEVLSNKFILAVVARKAKYR